MVSKRMNKKKQNTFFLRNRSTKGKTNINVCALRRFVCESVFSSGHKPKCVGMFTIEVYASRIAVKLCFCACVNRSKAILLFFGSLPSIDLFSLSLSLFYSMFSLFILFVFPMFIFLAYMLFCQRHRHLFSLHSFFWLQQQQQ